MMIRITTIVIVLFLLVSGEVDANRQGIDVDRYLLKIESLETRHHMNRTIYLLRSGVCEHLYLDVGTNRGIQIRKLYEPSLYPDAKLPKYFNEYFGEFSTESRRKVCTIGFEPNEKWDSTLLGIEEAYKRQGFHVIMFTSTAASLNGANVPFYRVKRVVSMKDNIEASATLFDYKSEDRQSSKTGSVNFVSFVKLFVNEFRKAGKVVVMKMDIEGWEYELIPSMVVGGGICAVNFAFVEFHNHPSLAKKCPPNFVENLNWMLGTVKSCPTKFVDVDDETYSNTDYPLINKSF